MVLVRLLFTSFHYYVHKQDPVAEPTADEMQEKPTADEMQEETTANGMQEESTANETQETTTDDTLQASSNCFGVREPTTSMFMTTIHAVFTGKIHLL